MNDGIIKESLDGDFLELQTSERAVLKAASVIFQGFIVAGKVTPETEKELLEQAVDYAIRLAYIVDSRVQSEGETNLKKSGG